MDFNFSIKYYSDLRDLLATFSSRMRYLWLQTILRTAFGLNPRTENPNLCPKRTNSSPSLQQSMQVFSNAPSELQTYGPISIAKVSPDLRPDRVFPRFWPISTIQMRFPSQLGPTFLISNLIENTFPTSTLSFLVVSLTMISQFLSTPEKEFFLQDTFSSLNSSIIFSALSSGLKWLKQSCLSRVTYLCDYSSLPAPLQTEHTSIIDIQLRVPLPSQLQQTQNQAGRLALGLSCTLAGSSTSRDMTEESFFSDSPTIDTSLRMLSFAALALATNLMEFWRWLAAAARMGARSVTSAPWQKQNRVWKLGNLCFISWWTCWREDTVLASLQSLSLNCTFTVTAIQQLQSR